MQNTMADKYARIGKLVCHSGVDKMFDDNPEGETAFLGFLVKSAEEYFSEPSKINFNHLKSIGLNHLVEQLNPHG